MLWRIWTIKMREDYDIKAFAPQRNLYIQKVKQQASVNINEHAVMPEPIMLSQIKQKVDLRGPMEYARKKGVKVAGLTEQEKLSFMR